VQCSVDTKEYFARAAMTSNQRSSQRGFDVRVSSPNLSRERLANLRANTIGLRGELKGTVDATAPNISSVANSARQPLGHTLQAGVPPGSRYLKRATILYPKGAIQDMGGTSRSRPKIAHEPPAAISDLATARDPSSRRSPSIHHADFLKSSSVSSRFSVTWGFRNCHGTASTEFLTGQRRAIQLADIVQKPQSPS
jgi:hypothetical protein